MASDVCSTIPETGNLLPQRSNEDRASVPQQWHEELQGWARAQQKMLRFHAVRTEQILNKQNSELESAFQNELQNLFSQLVIAPGEVGNVDSGMVVREPFDSERSNQTPCEQGNGVLGDVTMVDDIQLQETSLSESFRQGLHEKEELARPWKAKTNSMEFAGQILSSAQDVPHLLRGDTVKASLSEQRVMLSAETKNLMMATGWKSHVDKHSGWTLVHAEEIRGADKAQVLFLTIMHSYSFQVLSALLIFANSVAIGVYADQSMKRALIGQGPPRWAHSSDVAFTILFILELAVRLVAERRYFILSDQCLWNVFDTLLILSAIMETFFETLNLSFIRIVRVFRMIRVMRVVRIFQVFRELRLMVGSVLHSLLSLCWALLLLMILIYCFAICFLQGGANYLHYGDVDPDIGLFLDDHFSSLLWTMFTLLSAISGGESWSSYARPFVEISTLYLVLFCFFIIFVVFGVLNVLTSVFVENASQISKMDHDMVIQEQMDRHDSYLNQAQALFRDLDTDGSGTIAFQEIKDNFEDPRTKAFFWELGLNVMETEGLFKLMDTDGSGQVPIEEFVVGCMRLKGEAKSVDVANMMYENKKQVKKQRMWNELLYGTLKSLQFECRSLNQELKAAIERGLETPEHEYTYAI